MTYVNDSSWFFSPGDLEKKDDVCDCLINNPRNDNGDGAQERGLERREAVKLLSGIAAALAGLATPAAVRTLGMTAVEAGDPALVGPLCGVRILGLRLEESRR